MRITKQTAAQIAGIHSKTLERKAQDPAFREATGYAKGVNGVVTYDETAFRSWAAGAGDVIEALEVRRPDPPARSEQPAQAEARRDLLADELFQAFLVPHKLYLTLDEAKALTHFPKSILRKHSELKHGRRVIKRSKLEKL